MVWPVFGNPVGLNLLSLSFFLPSQDFVDQFQVLLPKDTKDFKEEISSLLSKLELDTSSYQIGKTKVCTYFF